MKDLLCCWGGVKRCLYFLLFSLSLSSSHSPLSPCFQCKIIIYFHTYDTNISSHSLSCLFLYVLSLSLSFFSPSFVFLLSSPLFTLYPSLLHSHVSPSFLSSLPPFSLLSPSLLSSPSPLSFLSSLLALSFPLFSYRSPLRREVKSEIFFELLTHLHHVMVCL